MKKLKLGLAIATLSGGALACTVNALPPMQVEVSLLDMAKARWIDGYRHPVTAAFLGNLDEVGRQIYGDGWHANEFRGYVTIKSGLSSIGAPDGRHIQYIEKPCNSDAKDSEERNDDSGDGGGGDAYAGDSFFDNWSYISDWYFNYYQPMYYGTVGDITVLP